jgi:hypothetical protein
MLGREEITMAINIQTLTDALIAICVTVGIAVAVSILVITIGVFFHRGKNRKRAAPHAAPGQQATDCEDSRQLVLR